MVVAERESSKREMKRVNSISYLGYQKRGGIINEVDYRNAMEKTEQIINSNGTLVIRREHVVQANLIAQVAGITLENSEGHPDKVTTLYGVLRTDSNPGAKHHHRQMCDQRLFAEALRMLDYPVLFVKVIEAHPNINFV